MVETTQEILKEEQGDSAEFIETVRDIAIGTARESQPKHLYLVRIDNWFGPKWLHFAGKVSVAKHFYGGIHKTRLHVPPFVPSRVKSERVFATPEFAEINLEAPLHIDCPSKTALRRRIEDFDEDAVFVWFSSESKGQQRGAVMVYLPVESNKSAFYAGFAELGSTWQPSTLRHISRSELDGLRQLGRA